MENHFWKEETDSKTKKLISHRKNITRLNYIKNFNIEYRSYF